MLKSEEKLEGYSQKYKINVRTNEDREGQVTISGDRMADMLLAYMDTEGNSSIKGKFFNVWWNGKEKLESRYKIYALRQ